MEPYLDELLKRLLALLQNPKRYVQEQALSTIATIADSAEAAFGKYYDTLMPLLISVLNQPDHAKENRLLNAKAMECASLIALAVGKERLGEDAMQLVRIFGRIQRRLFINIDYEIPKLIHSQKRLPMPTTHKEVTFCTAGAECAVLWVIHFCHIWEVSCRLLYNWQAPKQMYSLLMVRHYEKQMPNGSKH